MYHFSVTIFFMKDRIFTPYFTLILAVLISTILLWLPFLLRVQSWLGLDFTNNTFLTLYKQYDGLLYVVVAKSLYNPDIIRSLRLELLLEPIYFAAHFPLYPLFIRVGSYIFGFMKSMILVNVLFSVLLTTFFYYFLKFFKVTSRPLALSIVFIFLPRFFITRTTGAPEPMFMLFILMSIFFFEQKKYFFAGIFGALATLTKSPGVLLAIAYALVFLERAIKEKKQDYSGYPILLIPIALLAVFAWYSFQYHDVLAYFHSGDNLHLVFPFSVFNYQKSWVGTAWLEDALIYFFMYALTVVYLWSSKNRTFFYFSVVFFAATLFVQHRDISRYSLPLWPFACIAFERLFTSKKFLIAAAIILPGIYLYAWNFLLFNILPVSDWRPFLP